MKKVLTPAGREFLMKLLTADVLARNHGKTVTQAVIQKVMDIVRGDKPSNQAAQQKKVYWERRNAGLCPHCGGAPAEGYVYCREYRVKKREYDEQYDQRRIENLHIAKETKYAKTFR